MRYQGGTFRLVDLCNAQGQIVGLEAEGVTFTGPAVVFPQSTEITDCSWDAGGGTIESIVWEIDPVRTSVVGAVHVLNCVLRNCTFENVGFAGNSETVNTFFGATNI